MSCGKFICLLLLLYGPVLPAERRPAIPQPDHFEIARHTFVDFGPPFDFYELFIVRTASKGTLIERFILTPPGDACMAPAKLEATSATTRETVDALLGSTNPCAIP